MYNSLFTTEAIFYVFLFCFVYCTLELIIELYVYLNFGLVKYSNAKNIRLIRGKYYIDGKRLYYDRRNIFCSNEIRSKDTKKLEKLIERNRGVRYKILPGFGSFISISGLNSNTICIAILMAIFLVVSYNFSSGYFYFHGLKLPLVTEIIKSR